jgi:hypothetical protein
MIRATDLSAGFCAVMRSRSLPSRLVVSQPSAARNVSDQAMGAEGPKDAADFGPGLF